MFKEMFTEAVRPRGGAKSPGSRSKSSSAAKITDMVKIIKGMDITKVMSYYDNLNRDYLSEDAWELFVQPGDYSDYYNDYESKSLLKKVLINFKKALKKLDIDYDVVDCAKGYLKDSDDYIADRVIQKTWEDYKNKEIGYHSIDSYRDAESFCKTFSVASNCIKAMSKLANPVVCDFNRAGLTKITYKEIEHKQGLDGHTTSFTQEFEVTVYHYGMKEKVVFNVSKTETTVHQSYWN